MQSCDFCSSSIKAATRQIERQKQTEEKREREDDNELSDVNQKTAEEKQSSRVCGQRGTKIYSKC